MGAQSNKQLSTKDEAIDIVTKPFGTAVVVILGIIALAFGLFLSVSLGAANIHLHTVWEAVFHFDQHQTSHQIIRELRLPRTVGAALVGAFLAISGAMMQGMTRNALASPEIMGVTNGSAFAIAIAFAFFPTQSSFTFILWSFVGAAFGASLVFGVGTLSKGGLTPVKLALAGTAVSTLLSSISSAIAIRFDVAQDMSFWYAGGVAGVNWNNIKVIIPVAILGFIIAMVLARSITVLSLGDELAKGLGQYTKIVKVLGILVVILLTGAAVSVAGSIGFIGLVIPHVTRFLVGVDYRWIIPCSAILGAVLLIYADIVARLINAPFETPVGAITAIIGVPFFLYLARRERSGI
ncbi:FecCD family ABC transporter permease [Bacillus sp. NPDC093026]|uniref:FecCD family ABC transporter permease n=1 Tax=Bacillus sp. NPDC093026 TaxID=3363948 RepID=UPI0037F22E4D